MAQNNNHNFFSKMFFPFFHRLKLFQEQTKNNQLESEVATLRHENYQMKFTKTHRKQDYVWHSILNISSHIITWLTQRLTGSRILFLYTTTDCTHSLNCVGVLPVIFLPSLRPRNYIYLTSARSSVQNLSFTTRRRFALLRLLREIKKFEKNLKKIFLLRLCHRRKDITRDFRQSELKKSCK